MGEVGLGLRRRWRRMRWREGVGVSWGKRVEKIRI
jgi:hypothetical protein